MVAKMSPEGNTINIKKSLVGQHKGGFLAGEQAGNNVTQTSETFPVNPLSS